jgi:hypothetical protein
MIILEAMQSYITSPVMFLLVLNVFLIVVGMLMDIFSAIVVVVPLIVPIANQFGIDPYHLGIIFLLNLEIGYLTPPVGLNLFIASFRFDKPVVTLYRAVLPFIGLLLVSLAVTTYVPALSTSLAGLYGDDAEPAPQPDTAPPVDDLGGGGGLDDLEAAVDEAPNLDDLDDLDGTDAPDLDDLDLDALEERIDEGGGGAPGSSLVDVDQDEGPAAPEPEPTSAPPAP